MIQLSGLVYVNLNGKPSIWDKPLPQQQYDNAFAVFYLPILTAFAVFGLLSLETLSRWAKEDGKDESTLLAARRGSALGLVVMSLILLFV